MIKNYLKIAWRQLIKNKGYSFINIGGLATGMAVAMLIGLWIYDELSFNKSYQNYDRIVKVMQHQTFNGEVGTQHSIPYVLGAELLDKHGNDFKYVVMSHWIDDHVLTFGDKKLIKKGNFFEPQITEMLTLKMLKGTRDGLKDPSSIMLSESAAKTYFGDTDPINKVMKMDNELNVKVTGVYEDFPYNSTFKDLLFIAPWELYISSHPWIKKLTTPWENNFTQAYAQVADNVDIEQLSEKIKNIKLKKTNEEGIINKPEIFLQPMYKWHLYAEFKNGVNIGGTIDFVWLFGIIGIFVLLLACINFMNLSTARSEKRAKEVGIRKTVGSVKGQLITQFFTESLLVVAFSFALSLLLVQLILPFFNEVADKKMTILWLNPFFWLLGIGFSLITGLIAGSYPAFYLSSFQPVKVLKGTFRVGRFASVPRKVLVVVQFTVSVTLIIGTIIVFRQIQFAKNRPIGYTPDGLIELPINTPDLVGHYDAIRTDLLKTGAVVEMSESSSPVTQIRSTNGGYEWRGKDPSVQGDFGSIWVTHDFGKTVGWQFIEGRNFSRDFKTDSVGIILNETAAKFMGFKNPIGEIITSDSISYKVIGVIKDMVMDSPYEPVYRSVFMLNYDNVNFINIKINPALPAGDALAKIEMVFKKYNPAAPFDYKFVDDTFAKKFENEERIGKLATFFAGLAILISCLGLFGMASFMAEQRVKEIGIRKIVGASVFNLWSLLSKDFVLLVAISCLLATPLAYYFMHQWL